MTRPTERGSRGSHPFGGFGEARSLLTLVGTNGSWILTYGGSEKDTAEAG